MARGQASHHTKDRRVSSTIRKTLLLIGTFIKHFTRREKHVPFELIASPAVPVFSCCSCQVSRVGFRVMFSLDLSPGDTYVRPTCSGYRTEHSDVIELTQVRTASTSAQWTHQAIRRYGPGRSRPHPADASSHMGCYKAATAEETERRVASEHPT